MAKWCTTLLVSKTNSGILGVPTSRYLQLEYDNRTSNLSKTEKMMALVVELSFLDKNIISSDIYHAYLLFYILPFENYMAAAMMVLNFNSFFDECLFRFMTRAVFS